MSLYKEWEDKANEERSPEDYNKFWEDYFLEEKNIYEKVLAEKENPIEGKFSELASKYGTDEVTFIGYIDGVNSSLREEIDTEKLESDSQVKLDIDYENENAQEILDKIMFAIEQTEDFNLLHSYEEELKQKKTEGEPTA